MEKKDVGYNLRTPVDQERTGSTLKPPYESSLGKGESKCWDVDAQTRKTSSRRADARKRDGEELRRDGITSLRVINPTRDK